MQRQTIKENLAKALDFLPFDPLSGETVAGYRVQFWGQRKRKRILETLERVQRSTRQVLGTDLRVSE